MKQREYIIIESTLERLIVEQTESETQDTDESNDISVFSDDEKRFLGTFSKAGTKHLGIIYALSDVGIQEFIARSGKTYNCNPAILLSLLRGKFIKIVSYGGWGRDSNYTIELQLSLDDVKDYTELAQQSQSDTAAPADMAGDSAPPAMPSPAETPPPPTAPGPENAGVIRYGTILSESITAIKHVLLEKKSTNNIANIHVDKSRILKELPKEYLKHLNSVITHLSKRSFSISQKKKLIADILDNLSINLKLTPKQIFASYEMHKNQKKLNDLLNKK